MSQELGDYIRRLREGSGVSVKELAERTRISLRYVEALEEGRIDVLPGVVFVRGFIRTIFSELGENPDQALYLVEEHYPEEEPEEFETVSGSRRVFFPLAVATVVLVVLLVGTFFLRKSDTQKNEELSPDEIAGKAASDTLSNETGIQTIGELGDLPDLNLVIQAIDKTWLRIQTDNSDSWETTMRPGDEVRLRASERINLLIGNAGGILFDLNGKQFGPPGSQGQVLSNYVITRDNL
jgi:cytoskeletal protein RodZ